MHWFLEEKGQRKCWFSCENQLRLIKKRGGRNIEPADVTSQLEVYSTVCINIWAKINLCLQHRRIWKWCTIWLSITSLQHCYSCNLCLQGCNLNVPLEPCNLVDTTGSCLRHRRIRAILQQILKPSRHCWTLCFENEKCLDANTYVPSEPCNLVDTKVAYGTVEFVLLFSKF